MLMSIEEHNGTPAMKPGIDLGHGLRLRPEQPTEMMGVCPRCRVLLSFEVGLAPDLSELGLDDKDELARMFASRRGRPRKQATPASPAPIKSQPATVNDPAALAKRLIVYDRKVRLEMGNGEVRLVHAACGMPLNLFH